MRRKDNEKIMDLQNNKKMCELVEKNIDLGRADESAAEIAEMLLMVAPKGLKDSAQFNLALAGAMHAYTFTSHFENSFNNFLGFVPDSLGPADEAEDIQEISDRSF